MFEGRGLVDLIDWGAPLIGWLQAQSWLHEPARFFSAVGDVRFMIVWIPIVTWTVDHRLGRRLLVAMASWGAINTLLKLLFAQPRPYWTIPAIEPLAAQGSYGFPSGHAAFAMCVWGAVALAVDRRWVRALSVFMILAIGSSRVVLGVHWPADVIGGWVLGAGVLALAAWADGGRRPDSHALPAVHLGPVGAIVAGALAGVLPLAVTAVIASEAGPIDPGWVALAARSGEALDPTNLLGAGILTGGLVGIAVGSVAARVRGEDHSLDAPIGDRVLRALIGLLGLLLIAAVLDSLVDGDDQSMVPLAWLIGAAAGWWILDGGPRVMRRLGLGGPPDEANSIPAS